MNTGGLIPHDDKVLDVWGHEPEPAEIERKSFCLFLSHQMRLNLAMPLQSSYWEKSAVLSTREEMKAPAHLYRELRHWRKMVPLRIKPRSPLQAMRCCRFSSPAMLRVSSHPGHVR